MSQLKEILICTSPFVITGMLVYPFVAIVGGSFDPFAWQRDDRIFYFVCTLTFGLALLYRIQYVSQVG